MVSSALWERGAKGILAVEGIDRLIAALRADGREVLGPVPQDGAICLGPVRSLHAAPDVLPDSPGHGRARGAAARQTAALRGDARAG